MNRWGIPAKIEEKVRLRDIKCVYCGVSFDNTVRNRATFEHFNNDRWDDASIMHINIALCCGSCNSSKGAKKLKEGLNSDFCKKKNISEENVANCVKEFLKSNL